MPTLCAILCTAGLFLGPAEPVVIPGSGDAVHLANLATASPFHNSTRPNMNTPKTQQAEMMAKKILKEFEGFRGKVYRDSAKIPTIGYGHTAYAGDPNPNKIKTITRKEAEKVLDRDIANVRRQIAKKLKVPLNEHQLAAIISFVFNVGIGAANKSGVFRTIRRGDFEAVPNRLARWNKITENGKLKPLRGLTRRRTKEAELFMRSPPLASTFRRAYIEEQRVMPASPHERRGLKSNTNKAAIGGLGITVISTTYEKIPVVSNAIDRIKTSTGFELSPEIGAGVIVLAAVGFAAFIVYDRNKKALEEGV